MPPAGEMPVAEAQEILEELASAFFRNGSLDEFPPSQERASKWTFNALSDVQARYRSLVEQIPAVVFMVYLDRGIGEAYVSPHIEAALGFSQAEWLEDPVRWYRQIHPEDNLRWSEEAAELFLTGKPLRSVYRVIARDGRIVWFQCEAKMERGEDGQPWFIHGVGFDISELKRTEEALQEERNFVSTILDTVGTLVMVLDPDGRVVRFNRACEQATGLRFQDVRGRHFQHIFGAAADSESFHCMLEQILSGKHPDIFETRLARNGNAYLISWSGIGLPDANGKVRYLIATGVDVTEAKRLEEAILDISAREQRRIGQDLHDGLGQHLTGIAFLSKVLEQKLADRSAPEAAEALQIVQLVNDAISKTRELSRGLLPVVSDSRGLMSALERLASDVEKLFGTSCSFECDRAVLLTDNNVATHLYAIAQEAVNNAIKHARAKRIVIKLLSDRDGLTLRVRDDGIGVRPDAINGQGMGMHIMNYRAKMIGGTLRIGPANEAGTVVICWLGADTAHLGES